jgi:hypothetical protein
MAEPAAFDALAREFFSVWFRFHPEAALAVGVGDYGTLPAPQSDDDHAALGSWLETLIVALEELDHAALDPGRRLDAELLFALAAAEHRTLLERDWRRRDPLRFLPLAEIHRLTLLRPASLRDDLLALLAAIPAHLRLAMTQLLPMAELIPPPLVALAVQAADAGPGYLRELIGSRWLRTRCHGTGEIEAAAEDAAAALHQYAAGLRNAVAPRAAGPCGCGAAHLGFLLRHRHRLALSPEDCVPLLDRLARELETPAVTQAAADHNAPGTSPAAQCAAQEALLREAELITLPAAPLEVARGPARPQRGADDGWMGWPHLRDQAPGVDYVPDLIRGRGTLYLAGSGDVRQEQQPMTLRLRCLGLGWGGQHTLTFAGGMAARSLPRLLAGGVSLTCGWPLSLLDQVLPSAGGGAQPVRRAAVAHARLDLDLHLGRLSLAEARARAALHGDPDTVLAGLMRNPGESLAAVLGWQLIEAGRRQYLRENGSAGEVRRFHDALVAQGTLPATAALAAILGASAGEQLLADICGGGEALV